MPVPDFFLVKVNSVFKRLERKVKTIRILYLETEEKIHLCKRAGFEDDLAKDKGGLFQDPIQAGHKQNRKGKKADKTVLFHGRSI